MCFHVNDSHYVVRSKTYVHGASVIKFSWFMVSVPMPVENEPLKHRCKTWLLNMTVSWAPCANTSRNIPQSYEFFITGNVHKYTEQTQVWGFATINTLSLRKDMIASNMAWNKKHYLYEPKQTTATNVKARLLTVEISFSFTFFCGHRLKLRFKPRLLFSTINT